MAMHEDPNVIKVNSVQTYMRAARLLVAERWNGSARSAWIHMTIPNSAVAKKIDCLMFNCNGKTYDGIFAINCNDAKANGLRFRIVIQHGDTFLSSGTMVIYEPVALEEAKKKTTPKAKKTAAKPKHAASKPRKNPIAKAKEPKK